jgi:GNAT superfamily N-acetyltransferase
MRFEQKVLAPPPWPRDVASIRNACFPASFTKTCSPAGRNGSWVITAIVGRRVLGYAQVVPYVGDETTCNLEEVGVDPQHRHVGVGRRIIFEAAVWMHNEGYPTMVATPLAGAEMDLRIRWFRSLGFERDGTHWKAETAKLSQGVDTQ